MSTTQKSAARRSRSPGRPRLEDVADIDSKLLAVALKEFTIHGYGATSLTRIVKIAGVAKTTLYARFASKEQLFRAIMHEQIERFDAATMLRPGISAPELEKGLKAYANRMLEISLQGHLLEVNRLIASESHRFPELAAAAAEKNELGVKRISNFIRECAIADAIRCKDAEGVAEVFIYMLRGWYVHASLTNRKVPAEQRERWVERAVHTLLSNRADW